MVKLKFKLTKEYRPDLTQKIDDKQYGGIQLTYLIYKVYYFKLFKLEIPWFIRILGNKTFLRPYKKLWDKRTYRLPFVYWGKKSHPLTRLWVIPDHSSLGTNRIVPEASLQHQYVKLFGHSIKSKDITTRLFGHINKFNLIIN